MPETPLAPAAPPGGAAGVGPLAAEWRKTEGWMDFAARLTGRRVPAADAELCRAGAALVDALTRADAAPDFSAALARVLNARVRAADAVAVRIGRELAVLRKMVGEDLLQERFPENKYGQYVRQLDRVAALAQAAENSAAARGELLEWMDAEWPAFCRLRDDLGAAKPAILGAKKARDRLQRQRALRFWTMVAVTLLAGLVGSLF